LEYRLVEEDIPAAEKWKRELCPQFSKHHAPGCAVRRTWFKTVSKQFSTNLNTAQNPYWFWSRCGLFRRYLLWYLINLQVSINTETQLQKDGWDVILGW
jgi:hypothetical protein